MQNIIQEFKSQNRKTLLLENNDGFLFREDVIEILNVHDIDIIKGSSIKQRIKFELRNTEKITVLLNKNRSNFLEDIENKAVRMEFFLKDYLSGYHIPTVLNQDLAVLEKLNTNKQILKLSKKETERELNTIQNAKNDNPSNFNTIEFSDSIDLELNAENKDWVKIAQLVSKAILSTIGTPGLDEVVMIINDVNQHFQEVIKRDYQQSKNSSAVKKPKIVSRVLDFIDFNFKQDKVALIVIDGMSFWQYQLIANH